MKEIEPSILVIRIFHGLLQATPMFAKNAGKIQEKNFVLIKCLKLVFQAIIFVRKDGVGA